VRDAQAREDQAPSPARSRSALAQVIWSGRTRPHTEREAEETAEKEAAEKKAREELEAKERAEREAKEKVEQEAAEQKADEELEAKEREKKAPGKEEVLAGVLGNLPGGLGGPGEGGGLPAGVPTLKTPPVPRVGLASRALVASPSGAVDVRVGCPASESRCTGTVMLRTLAGVRSATGRRSKKRRAVTLTLAAGSFTAAGGQVTTAKLHLSVTARGLLARMHVLHARATILARDPAGATHTTRALVTIRAARRRHAGGARRQGR